MIKRTFIVIGLLLTMVAGVLASGALTSNAEATGCKKPPKKCKPPITTITTTTTSNPPCIPANPDGTPGGKDGKPGNDDCAADVPPPPPPPPPPTTTTESTPTPPAPPVLKCPKGMTEIKRTATQVICGKTVVVVKTKKAKPIIKRIPTYRCPKPRNPEKLTG